MNEERFEFGFDNIAIKALRKETNIKSSYTPCRMKGCVRILSSPKKVEEKMKEIKKAFPEANILKNEHETISGYNYVTIQLWEEE